MKEIKILSDNPEEQSGNIKFDFHAYKNTFVDIIEGGQNETPLVIGLEGRWGRGKTTLMKNIMSQLKSNDKAKIKDGKRRCKTVWFQAWKYNDADNLLAALLESIVQEMGKGNFYEKATIGIKKVWEKLNLKAIPEFFTYYAPYLKDASKLIKEDEYKKNLPYFDLFSKFMRELIRLWIHAEDTFKLTESDDFKIGGIDDQKGVLVIFIDDLDRCNTQNIVKVLEAIKLFLDFKGCIFVMGVSKGVIVNALNKSPHIGDEYANEYLEKMIQVSYELPIIHREDMRDYFNEKVSQFEYGDILKDYSDVIVKSLGDTPRKIKKFINNLNIQIKVADYKGLFLNKRIEIKDYVYWNVLKEAFNEELILIKRTPDIVTLVKEGYEKHKEDIENEKFESIDKIPFEPVREILRQPDIRNIVVNLPDNRETLETLIYESMAVGLININVKEVTKLVESLGGGERVEEFMKERISPVGYMVSVEKGAFLYGDEKIERYIDYDYEIDIFPVTNMNFCKFLNDKKPDGVGLYEWINLEGYYGKEKCRISKYNDKFTVEKGFENHPVIFVSWYGADEYARSNDKRLPTEEEWEKAASGPKGWIYPWGDKFDKFLCNYNESDIGGTTEVDKYPDGKSYYGCYDMAGNVWECTSNYYDEDKCTYVLRGGSWGHGSDYCRCTSRFRINPNYRGDHLGFRCARTIE